MLSAKINNQWIDMFPGTSIKYVFNSPAFSDSPIVGDFSYTVSFPLTDVNKGVFDYVNLADNFEDTVEFDIELYNEGIYLIFGVFQIKNVSGKISGNIINSAFSFSNQIKNKTTKDLDLGGTIDLSIITHDVFLLSVINGCFPDYNFTLFPVLNEILYDGTIVEAAWHDILYINRYNPSTTDHIFYPYLAYVINQIFKTFNYNISNSLANNNELSKLVLLGVFKENLYDLYVYNHYNLVEHIIECDLIKLLKQINSTFCTSFFFDHKTQSAEMIFNKDLLSSTDYVDWTDKVVGEVNKEFEEIEDGYNLNYDFDSADQSISDRQIKDGIIDEYTMELPVLTPDDLPIYENMGMHGNEVRYVTCEDTYYIIKNFPNPNPNYIWIVLTWNFFSKITGEGLKERRSKLSTLGMNWHLKETGTLKDDWMVPHSNQELFSDPIKGFKDYAVDVPDYDRCIPQYVNKFEPRILFYRGMCPDVSNNNYPLGSSGKYDAKGNSLGNLTLNWDGDDGLYENFHKKWLTFRENSKPQKFLILLNEIDLLNLKINKKIKINSNFYLPKKITIDLPIKKSATVEMYRI